MPTDQRDKYAEILTGNLRAWRAMRRLNQAQAAEGMRALGFPTWLPQTVSQVERGKRELRVTELMGLAQVYATRPERLING